MRTLVVLGLLAMGSVAEGSFINYSAREINVKIVYYGPSSTPIEQNLQYVYGKTAPEAKGKLISLAIEKNDRTLFFDFLPLNLGVIRGFHVRFHLYSSPTQASSEAARKLILKGADGIVFVADSDPGQTQATLASWESLKRNLADQGYDYRKMPFIVQLDHRKHPNELGVEDLKRLLGLTDETVIEAVSATGVGVFDSLKSVAKQTLMQLKAGAK
jgi:signal recognition particle receptor subunit beta